MARGASRSNERDDGGQDRGATRVARAYGVGFSRARAFSIFSSTRFGSS
jgi:hypothetical protein